MKFLNYLALGLVASTCLLAQSTSNSGSSTQSRAKDEDDNGGLWTANLPGGTYMVRIGTISSIARQRYVLDSGLEVNEVSVETTGAALARFYFIQPVAQKSNLNLATNTLNRVSELSQVAGQRSGLGDPNEVVTKNYPTTTHAKTIEYRLASEAELDQLFASLQNSLRSGRARKFTIR